MGKLAFLRTDLLCPHLETFYLLRQLVFFRLLQLLDQIHDGPMVALLQSVTWNFFNTPPVLHDTTVITETLESYFTLRIFKISEANAYKLRIRILNVDCLVNGIWLGNGCKIVINAPKRLSLRKIEYRLKSKSSVDGRCMFACHLVQGGNGVMLVSELSGSYCFELF